MRKVPVLTAVTLLAISSLAVAPVYAGTALANDPPSLSLAPGANQANAFNINDFFADPTGASITGGSLDGSGNATVDGLATAGTKEYSISNSAGESGSASVWASAAKFTNRPAIDNNNRLVGVAGGNWFANWIVAGGSVSSNAPLGNAGGGGSGTPGGATGGGALSVSVGEVSISYEGTWRKRTSGPASDTGISATIDAAGNYTISASAADDPHPAIVTFSAGTSDAVQVLAAHAHDVGAPIVGTHTVQPGQAALVIGTAPVDVEGVAQLSLTYNASSVSGVAIAVIGFDGGVAFQSVTYSNPSGPGLEAGTAKSLSTSIRSESGSVIPAVQVFNGGSAAVTVNITRFAVAHAGPLVDYAINPNHNTFEHALDDGAGVIPDILQQGATAPTYSGGSMVLAAAGATGISNGTVQAALSRGTAVAECYVQRVGAATDGSVFVLNVTDGGATSYAAFKPGSSIPTDGWLMVQAAGTIQADGTGVFITAQAASGLTVNVDNLSVRQIDQDDNQFDANLLG
jgi:hypothetical protein